MKRFKNHKPGFTFIETMFALTLLTIFGTSLFMLQANIVSKTSKFHNKVIKLLNINKIKSTFDLQAFQRQKQKKPLDGLVVSKDVNHPDMKVEIKTNKISEQSELFKEFSEHSYLIQQRATIDNVTEQFISFIFAPEAEPDKEES